MHIWSGYAAIKKFGRFSSLFVAQLVTIPNLSINKSYGTMLLIYQWDKKKINSDTLYVNEKQKSYILWKACMDLKFAVFLFLFFIKFEKYLVELPFC